VDRETPVALQTRGRRKKSLSLLWNIASLW
jgi:hypothetical protein